jgi:hypothetical protein
MARDRHGPALARERRAGIVAGSGAQVARSRALDEHLRDPDRRDDDAPHGIAGVEPSLEGAGPEREPAARFADPAQGALLGRPERRPLELAQAVVERRLAEVGVDRRHGLLPQQRRHRVDQQHRAGDDHHARQRPQRAAGPIARGGGHRRSADSVPPSDPGPA